ncbi:MAG TPA: hypothetical protein VF178_15935 [Gemmatimonadaceae bacterium]
MVDGAAVAMPAAGPGAVSSRRVALTWAPLARTLALLSLPALLDPGVMARAGALRDVDTLSVGQLMLVHAWAPVVAVSAAVLMLLPGLVLAFPARGERGAGDWLVRAIAIAIVLLAVVVPVAEGAAGTPIRGRVFAGMVLVVTVAGAALTARRWRSVDPASRGYISGHPVFMASLAAVPALLFSVLAGKFLWESFNGDGAHAFESARLLLKRPLPFWDADAGPIASFPGVTSFVFAIPSSWYLRLFGELDVAARLPWLLHLGVLAAALSAFAMRLPRGATLLLIWVGLLPYAAAMAFSATYSPYSADIALPATQDTLLMVFVLGAVLAWVERDRRWLAVFTALTIASLPNGVILIGLLAVAALMVERPRPWRRAAWLLAVLGVCVVAAAIAPVMLRLVGLPAPGDEYGVVGLLGYFAFLQLTDWERVLYVAIPCGLIPVVTAARWGSLDTVARTIVLVAAAYFLVFFIQAYTALHHYVPSMILLLAAHWHALAQWDDARARRWSHLTLAGGAVALALAWPREAAPHRATEAVGRAIAQRVGDYEASDPAVFRASTLLSALFPYDWATEVPEAYGGSPLAWNRYAHHGGEIDSSINYVLQGDDMPPPAGMREVGRGDGAVVYVRSDSVWQADRARQPATATGSRWLSVPRGVLFRTEPRGEASPVIEVVPLLARAGIDVEALLQRLGVAR